MASSACSLSMSAMNGGEGRGREEGEGERRGWEEEEEDSCLSDLDSDEMDEYLSSEKEVCVTNMASSAIFFHCLIPFCTIDCREEEIVEIHLTVCVYTCGVYDVT